MIKLDKLQEVPIKDGDWVSREIVREGNPFHVVVIPKAIIEEVIDCCQSYAKDSGFSDSEAHDDNVDWILGIIAKATQERNGITLYEVKSK